MDIMSQPNAFPAYPEHVSVTAAEWFEAQSRAKDVEIAQLRLALAQQQQVSFQQQILTARGLPMGDYTLVREPAPHAGPPAGVGP